MVLVTAAFILDSQKFLAAKPPGRVSHPHRKPRNFFCISLVCFLSISQFRAPSTIIHLICRFHGHWLRSYWRVRRGYGFHSFDRALMQTARALPIHIALGLLLSNKRVPTKIRAKPDRLKRKPDTSETITSNNEHDTPFVCIWADQSRATA